jgi:polyhydroxyalkanoate synthesis regulator protein
MVQDAKTGEDLTRAVLAQIIFEQENKKEGVLPVSFLRQLIQFYGDNFQTMLPAYLELSMKTFNQQQEKWRDYMNDRRRRGQGEGVRRTDPQEHGDVRGHDEVLRAVRAGRSGSSRYAGNAL